MPMAVMLNDNGTMYVYVFHEVIKAYYDNTGYNVIYSSFHTRHNETRLCKLLHATQITKHMQYTVIYIEIYIDPKCIFLICIRVNVGSNNKTVVIMRSASSY